MPTILDRPVREEAWHQQAGRQNGAPALLNGARKGAGGVTDAGPWEPAVQRIVGFQQLGDDWDGQGARAPSLEMLACAIGLAYVLYENGMDPPTSVVPGLEGAVIFEWQGPDGLFCEVEIVRPFHAEVMVVEPGKPARHWTLPTE